MVKFTKWRTAKIELYAYVYYNTIIGILHSADN